MRQVPELESRLGLHELRRHQDVEAALGPGCVKTRLESELFAIRIHFDSPSIPRRLGNSEFSHSLGH
jgi:hypothetical protein